MQTQSQPPAAGEAAETLTPLYFIKLGVLVRSDGKQIAEFDSRTTEAERAEIRRACNSHETVCNLLRRCESAVDEKLASEIRQTLRDL